MKRENKRNTNFQPIPIQKRRTRYQVTAAVTNASYTSLDLHNAVGLVATTAILGNGIAQLVKLKRVEIFSPVFSSAAQAACSIRTVNVVSPGGNGDTGFLEPRKTIYDTSMDVTDPAHVTYVPSPSTLASAWHNPNTSANAAILFQFDATIGSYMDVWFDYTLNIDTNGIVVTTTQALVGATAGQIYLRPLAGSATVTPDPNIYAVI